MLFPRSTRESSARIAGWVPAVPGAHHADAQRRTQVLRLNVQVVEHFEVIGKESDGHEHDVLKAARPVQLPNRIAHVRLEPRLVRWPAPALIDQSGVRVLQPLRDQTTGLG